MTFQAVLFDMDGTLINSEPYWLIAETELMAEFGYQWQLSDQSHCLGGPLPKVGRYMSDLAGGAEDWEFFMNSLVHRVTDKFHEGLDFMPGALELLEDLHAHSITLAKNDKKCNRTHYSPDERRRQTNISGYYKGRAGEVQFWTWSLHPQ